MKFHSFFSVCCRSPLIPVRPNYSSGDILSGSLSGSLPQSSSGGSPTVAGGGMVVGSAPNLVIVPGGDHRNHHHHHRDISPDSGAHSWNNGMNNGSYSVSIYIWECCSLGGINV